MNIEVYADGSATIATKPGGYGWVLCIDGVKHSEGSGRIENATNNDAELEAAIMGLAAVLKYVNALSGCEELLAANPIGVTLVSDSQIILGWANGKNRFKQKTKMHKYHALQHLVKRLNAKTRWVEGHSGDVHNSRCDRLANWARKGIAEPPPPGKPRRPMKEISKDIEENNKKRTLKTKSLIGRKKLGTMSFWYKGKLKIIDLDVNVVEDYDKDIHGNRKSHMELRIDEK